MLAMDYALDHPAGLRGIVVADSPASMTLWVSEANRLRGDLPPDVQETLTRHEEAGTTEDPEYEAAVAAFYERHVCRVVPMPDCVVRSFAQIAANPTVYHTMNGPSGSTSSGRSRRGTSPTGCTRSRRRPSSSPAATTRRPRSSSERSTSASPARSG